MSRADADDFPFVSITGVSGGFWLGESCEEISAAEILLLEPDEAVEAVLEGAGLGEEGAMIGYGRDKYGPEPNLFHLAIDSNTIS